MARSKRNWIEARQQYASGDETVSALATRLKMSRQHAYEHAAEDNWDEARRSFRETVAQKVTAAAVKYQFLEAAEVNERQHRIAVNGVAVSNNLMVKLAKMVDALPDPDGPPPEPGKTREKVSIKDVKSIVESVNKALASSATAFEQLRISGGIPLPAQVIRHEGGISSGLAILPPLKPGTK